jgi:hypothetical protein
LLILRFLKVLSVGLWVGSIFFFAIAVAPVAFSVLPTHMLAGMVVSRSLVSLHWIGIACGLVFLLCAVLIALIEGGETPFHRSDLLIVAMMALTLVAHFGIERRMNTLRTDMGMIDTIPHEDARRVEFNRLHVWSERMEETVFFGGLVLLYLVVREQNTSERRYWR